MVGAATLRAVQKFKALRQRVQARQKNAGSDEKAAESHDDNESAKGETSKSRMGPLKASVGSIAKMAVKAKRWLHSTYGNDEHRVTNRRSAAFVTFSSIKDASVIEALPVTSMPNRLITKKAPTIPDVDWTSVGIPPSQRIARSWIVFSIATVLLVPGFGFFVTFIGILFNPDSMKENYPAFYDFFQSMGKFGLNMLKQLAPVLLVVAVQIVPLLMGLVVQQEGKSSWTSGELLLCAQILHISRIEYFSLLCCRKRDS